MSNLSTGLQRLFGGGVKHAVHLLSGFLPAEWFDVFFLARAEMAYKGRAAAAAGPGGLGSWFRDYSHRRYAAAGPIPTPVTTAISTAWQLLAHSVYSCKDKVHNTVCDIPTSRPGLSRSEIMGWGLAPHLWYNVNDVRAAWELLLQAVAAAPQLADSSAFVYDLLDVSRELMSKIGRGRALRVCSCISKGVQLY